MVRQGRDDQFEFEFSLDLLLDGFERLRRSVPAYWLPCRQSVVNLSLTGC